MDQGQHKIDVIVPTYNYGCYLNQCLLSVYNQTFTDYSVLIIDNASEDNTEVLAQSWIKKDRRFNYIRNNSNIGLSGSMTLAYQMTSADYIVVLSSDDYWEKTFLEKTVFALERYNHCSFAYAAWRIFVDKPGTFNHGKSATIENPFKSTGIHDIIPALIAHNWITNSTCLFRRKICDAVGGTDIIGGGKLRHVGDWFLWMSFLAKGPAFYIHEELAHYRNHGKAETDRLVKNNISGLDHLLFYDSIFLSELWDFPVRLLAKAHQIRWLTGEPLIEIARKMGGKGAHPLVKQLIETSRESFHYIVAKSILNYPRCPFPIDTKDNALLFLEEMLTKGSALTPQIGALYSQYGGSSSYAISQSDKYSKYLARRLLIDADAQLFAERMMHDWQIQPIIHILVEVALGEELGLADTVDSLSQQLYSDWRLVILAPFFAPDNSFDEIDIVSWHVVNDSVSRQNTLNALLSDDERVWFWRLPAGTQLEAQTLLSLGDYINLYPQVRLFYCDDDERGLNNSYQNPRFKPDFNIDYLYSYNYLGPCAISAQALKFLGGWHSDGEAQSYDFALRILEQCGEPALAHIPQVLIHLPQNKIKSLTESSHRQAVMEHLERRNIEADIQEGYFPNTFNMVYHWPQAPLVSIIIPTRDRLDLLKPCVESLLDKTQYPNYEVLIVDNQSEKPETLEYFQKLEQEYSQVWVIQYAKPYNYSAINNAAAEQANGDYLVLLNNDTVIVQENWLDRMLNHGQRQDVGIVGARLVFPNQTIQHAGVILGMGSFGVADHPHIGLPITDSGYMNRAQVVQNFSAVTAACMLIRKSVYFEVGGLDEESFKVLFNDVDLCLKVRERGYKIVWTPHAMVVHHGSSSIKADRNPDQANRARQEADKMLEKWLPQLANDPAYNRNLSLKHRHFQIETETDVTWNVDFHDRPRVYAFPANDSGVGEYRVRSPLRALTHAAKIQSSLLPNHSETLIPDIVEIERAKPDVLLLQNGTASYLLHAWEQYRKFNDVFMIYSQDDLIYMLPGKHPLQGKWPKDLRKRLRKLLEHSDRLIVATEPLKEEYSRWISDVKIVPNYLEKAKWLDLTVNAKPRDGKKMRVGWAGGAQHQGDLEFILPVVEATRNEVDWIFMGMCPEQIRPFIKEYHAGVHFDLYPQKLADLDLDLAVAPLEYNNFNMAKTNLRLLEYGVLGWPVVCSDITPYRNAPVTRVSNNVNHWIKAIREKVNEPDALVKEGQVLKQWVLDHYLLEDHLDEWMAAITPS